jgi:hypothetical protein
MWLQRVTSGDTSEKLQHDISARSTIVLENTPDNSTQLDMASTLVNRKYELISWLQGHNIPCTVDMRKGKALQLLKKS